MNAKDDLYGDTPLLWAASFGNKEVVEMLITKGADVNAKAEEGWTPLHYATGGNDRGIAELLIANGADLNAKTETLLPIIKEKVQPDSVVYTDSFKAYNALDVSDFHHRRINHSTLFAEERNHINGIENFWNQAKRHLRRFNGIKSENFYWFLKECEWRFNGGNH